MDWSTILAENDRWLRTTVYARLREPDAVDEVMQEISLAVIRQAAPLGDITKVAPWLYRLAVRQVLLYRRKCGRRRKLTERVMAVRRPAEHDAATPDPLDWLVARERRRNVRRALDSLPPRDAEILLLKYTEDWDYHQIARQLGVSHSAVETRLHRARKRLRTELAALEAVEIRT